MRITHTGPLEDMQELGSAAYARGQRFFVEEQQVLGQLTRAALQRGSVRFQAIGHVVGCEAGLS